MNKIIKIGTGFLVFLISVLFVLAVTTETTYNPFTSKLDYITSLNQTGNDFIADAVTASGNLTLGNISKSKVFEIKVNGTDIIVKSLQSDLPIRLLTYSPNGSAYICYANNTGSFICDSR